MAEASSSAKTRSAGGQLEQPSDVKSSTSTGARSAARRGRAARARAKARIISIMKDRKATDYSTAEGGKKAGADMSGGGMLPDGPHWVSAVTLRKAVSAFDPYRCRAIATNTRV